MFGFARRRRERLKRTPLPADRRLILEANLPAWRRLDDTLRTRLAGLVQVFLHEKSFEGCGGMEISDEVRVTIAAHACLLLAGLDRDEVYPSVSSVLVYPDEFVVKRSYEEEGGFVMESEEALTGEAGGYGNVVLSWTDVSEAARRTGRGYNVVVHEFAHILDEEAGGGAGAPSLADHAMAEEWARVLSREYERLSRRRRHAAVLDEYGATDPAEFFAVATEAFFDNPRGLWQDHRELYEQLARFYLQDPARWGQTG